MKWDSIPVERMESDDDEDDRLTEALSPSSRREKSRPAIQPENVGIILSIK